MDMKAEYETTINALLAENDKLIKLVDWQNEEIERLRSELNQIRRFALNGEMDTVVSDEIERLREALRLGVDARAAQRAYFKDRSQSNLVASKQSEAAFDKAARAALGEEE